MRHRKLIDHNPYRVLGVYVGSPKSEEISHLNRIRAFSRVNRTVSFAMKGDDLLSAINRTRQMAEEAAQTLSLPQDRIENALLWFGTGDSNWSRTLNEAVEALIRNDYAKATESYERLNADAVMREQFLHAATFGLLMPSKEELSLKISKLVGEFKEEMETERRSPEKEPQENVEREPKETFDNEPPEPSIYSELEMVTEALEPPKKTEPDLYRAIEWFYESVEKAIAAYIEAGITYGVENYHYQIQASEAARKILKHAKSLLSQIGKFIWNQDPKYRSIDCSYIKRRAELPVGCIRASMDLMREVDDMVQKSLSRLRLSDLSLRTISSSIESYCNTKRIEFVDDDKEIRRAVRSFHKQRGITIAIWLIVLFMMFPK